MNRTDGAPGADRLTVFAARSAAFVSCAAAGALFALIAFFALKALFFSGGAALFGWSWLPARGEFGVLPMFAGSLALAALTAPPAFILSLMLVSVMLSAPRSPVARAAGVLVRLMSAIPTVVYAFGALLLLTPLMRAVFGGSGLGLLTTMLVLALLALPTMTLTMKAGLEPRLEEASLAALSLGMTRQEALFFICLGAARKNLLAAALLGFGRAIGDTLLPLSLSGNAPQPPRSLLGGFRTLSAHIALAAANEAGGAAYDSIFVAGAGLLAINLAVFFAAKLLVQAR